MFTRRSFFSGAGLAMAATAVGKSALARQFTERVQRNVGAGGVIVFSARCYERESVPYKALDGVIDALAQFLARLPEEYFPEIEEAHTGALASQWIPMDSKLWKVENFREFLEARKSLLAAEVNKRLSHARELVGIATW